MTGIGSKDFEFFINVPLTSKIYCYNYILNMVFQINTINVLK